MPPQGLKRLPDGRSVFQVDLATLNPEEVETLKSLDTIWNLPNGLERLRPLKRIFEMLRDASEAPESDTVLATSFNSVVAARDAVGVEYHQTTPYHMWQLSNDEKVSDGRLSQWADQCIETMAKSTLFGEDNPERIRRTILDMIFCDRFDHLVDLGEFNLEDYINWTPGKSISTKSDSLKKTVRCKIDWCLCVEKIDDETKFVPTLIVIEAKKLGTAQSTLPQLIVSLAAAQVELKGAEGDYRSVYGILTDSLVFFFAHLEKNGELFVSKPYSLHIEQVQVVQWIDKLLASATGNEDIYGES